jgi:hypothetical protein
MTSTYQDYCERFRASRGGKPVGSYTVSNGKLVQRLTEEEFQVRRWELEEVILIRGQIERDQNTMPIMLEGALDLLLAELLLPADLLSGLARDRAVAA